MNQADLIWHLVELLIHKEKELNQLANDKVQNNNQTNAKKQDET